MNKLILFIPIIFLIAISFNYAYAIDNNCYINPIHILLVKIPLGCIEDRLDALENAPSGDLTTASNLGSVGEGVFASEVGDDLQFKKLVAGSGITIESNATRLRLNSTGGAGESTNCNNVGSGTVIHVIGSNCNAKSLLAGTNIQITNTANDITLTTPLIAQEGSLIYQQLAKTNIGTTYIDIYTASFVEEDAFGFIDFRNSTYFRVFWLWDYVGTGNQQLRWVQASNNTNVLFETNTFNVDQVGANSVWTLTPSWAKDANEFILLEWQGKSSVGTDDPIAYGYKIVIK